jgi:GNAT superfamily N-acetyltransferase
MKIQQIDISLRAIAEEVLKLQHLAYQVEADLIKDNTIPYLTQGLSDLMRAESEIFYAAIDNSGKIIGGLSFKIANNGVLDVHRFMVHPAHFRQGVASSLLDHARDKYFLRKIIAQTGINNHPAIAFYNNRGVPWVCDIKVNSVVELATFEVNFMTLEEYLAQKEHTDKVVVD